MPGLLKPSLWMPVCALTVLTSVAVAQAPELRAGALSSPIRIDGSLDESAWQSADSIANLTQIEPTEGATPSGTTVVKVLMSKEDLIIGIRAENRPGVGIVAFARERDASLESEDHIRIVLDTYLDGRSGYVFAVNPNGARYDAVVAERGVHEDSNWDAAWEAATHRSENGWTAEIRIPVRSLLFRSGLTSWGFNIQRRIQRLQETDRWASPERDYKITLMSRAGRLTGLPALDLGRGASVRPSISGKSGYPAPRADLESHSALSVDATQRIGGNTIASLTVNTDFGETEVDTRRTNLTRFPLFFPEKRTFFLEGSDIFDFGIGLNEDILPFFSRRVGLLNGIEVPLDVGGKINGRLGDTNFGGLVVRTGRLDTLNTTNTMSAFRVKQNVLGESTVGMIATFGDPQGIRDSWLGGVDLTYQTSHFRGDKNFLAGIWGLAMDHAGLGGRKTSRGFKIDYPNDLWDVNFRYKWIDDAFEPSLGFVPRPGVQIAGLGVNYSPRPTRPIGPLSVRQMFVEFEPQVVTDLDGKWQSYEVFFAPINWRLESGDRFEFNIVPMGERLTEPFEISDGVVIPAGAYRWKKFRLEGGLAQKRQFSGQLTWWFGEFYNGHLNQIEIRSAWKPSPLFILEISGERDVGRLPEGNFTENVIGTKVRLNFSPDLQLNSLVQYDTQSRSLGSNTRLRWTFDPLGDLFVVYNHNLLKRDRLNGDTVLGFDSNQLLLKAQYNFRF
jgi:hypothetical protein